MTYLIATHFSVCHKNGIYISRNVKYLTKEESCKKLILQKGNLCNAVNKMSNKILLPQKCTLFHVLLCSVECYDATLDKWTLVASMNSARSGAAVAAANKYIYALGGYNGTTQLSSVERYDPVLDEWTLVSNMLDHRSALSVASYENKLYVFGGYDGEKFHDTVEVYDCEHDQWKVVASMSMGRSGAAVVVGVRPAM